MLSASVEATATEQAVFARSGADICAAVVATMLSDS